MSASSKLSAFIVCCNEERNIGRALSSIKWCDEIIVVDSGSTDRTLEICNEFTCKVISRPWPGFVEQKKFALGQCQNQWVLNIDADEEVSPELRIEIEKAIVREDINGYYLSRVVFYLNRWWRKGGWYPEYRLRLCKKEFTDWGGEDPHEKALVRGKTAKLSGELRHYTYGSISEQIRSINSLSQASAVSMHKKGRKFSFVALLLRPPLRFAKFYIFKQGFREGIPGLMVGVLEGISVFIKYAKLWEIERNNRADKIARFRSQ